MKKEKTIFLLLAIFVVCFAATIIFVVPRLMKSTDQHSVEQMNPLTHKIESVLEYKNAYMGNASNLFNLYYNLPLATSKKTFELISQELTLNINFADSIIDVGKQNMSGRSYSADGTADALNTLYQYEVKKSMIYDSTTAFALIENLQKIKYNFKDGSFEINRSDINNFWKNDLKNYLDNDNWTKLIESKLASEESEQIVNDYFK